MSIPETAALLAAACYASVILLFFALHLVAPQRSMLSHAVSDYGLGGTARLFIVYGVAGCLGAGLLAIATATDRTTGFPVRVTVYLASLAVLRLGVLRFRTDPAGGAATREGRWHYLFAVVTFALTYMAVSAAQPTVDAISSSTMRVVMEALGWSAAASLACVVFTLLPPLKIVFGLAERIFLLSTALWLLMLAVTLAMHA